MDGALSGDPRREEQQQRGGRTDGNGNGDAGAGSKGGQGGGGGGGGGAGGGGVDGRGDEMEIDSRGNARGQTEEMIKAQERRVQETARGLWSSGAR